MKIGFPVPMRLPARWGTAMPTKETGPAKAVTQAERMLERTTKTTRNLEISTPKFWT